MNRIALFCLTALALGGCATQPYGPYVPDARLESPGPVLAATYPDMAPAAPPAPIIPPVEAGAPMPALYAEAPPTVVVDALPRPLDPEPLPPNTVPGDCVERVADGPSYRWDRIACPAERATTLSAAEAYQQSYAYSIYPGIPPQGYAPGYATAGRDFQGYLTWPGKVPAR